MKVLLLLSLIAVASFSFARHHYEDDVDEEKLKKIIADEIIDTIQQEAEKDDDEDEFSLEENDEELDEEVLKQFVFPQKKKKNEKSVKNDPRPFWGRRRRRCASPTKKTCSNIRYNGCGSDAIKDLPFAHKKTLTTSCNKHDMCYNCGKHYGWSQKQCDDRFFQDMKRACRCKEIILTQPSCNLKALVLYGLVKAAGHNFYLKNSHSYCSQSCVIPYGSPHVTV